jgi:hypothetical protein
MAKRGPLEPAHMNDTPSSRHLWLQIVALVSTAALVVSLLLPAPQPAAAQSTVAPILLISEYFTSVSPATQSPYEYVELIATGPIDFSVTPFSVVFASNGFATLDGWVEGGQVTYGFNITTGSMVRGEVGYVGGTEMAPTGRKLRVINTKTVAGDRFGDANLTGVLDNGGSSADGIAVFAADISTLTSTSIPVGAHFFGSGRGLALVNSVTPVYELPFNDRYNGGKFGSTSIFGPVVFANQATSATTGTYNATTGQFTTARVWANGAASATSSITIASTGPAPTVANIVPANNATDIAVASNVTVTMSEAVTAPAAAFAIACNSVNQLFTIAPSSGSATSFTLDPTADLPYGATCTVTVTGSSVTDADADDPPNTMNGSHSVTFSTVPPPDTTAPSTTATAAPTSPNGQNGWYTSDVGVTLTATDGTGGSGVKEIVYSATGGQVIAEIVVSGSTVTFTISAEGTTTISYFARDNAGNAETPQTLTVMLDKTAPVLTVPSNIVVEATGPSGAAVTFSATATDATSGSPVVTCAPTSGSTFALGQTTVSCTAQDVAGKTGPAGAFTVTVQDTVKPVLTLPSTIVAEATGPSGAAVTYTATATDTVDGPIAPVCAPPSGATFALGSLTVACSATDVAGNKAEGGFVVTVRDTTPPALTVPSNISVPAAGPSGAAVTFSATATDLVSDPVTPTCTPASGSTFPVGTTTVACSAQDAAGNTSAPKTFTVTVTSAGYTWTGFFQPVDNVPTLNRAKAGSGIPVKFSLGGNFGLNVLEAGYPKVVQVGCTTGTPISDIESTVTAGQSSLQYDVSANQYVYVWKTSQAWSGTCQRLDVKLTDGTTHSVLFNFTK